MNKINNLKPIQPMTEVPFEDVGQIIKQQRLDEQQTRDERIAKLSRTPIRLAIDDWLSNLRESTRNNYRYYVNALIKSNLINEYKGSGELYTVGDFNSAAHEYVIKTIKGVSNWKEGKRQLYASCYISFTAYLNQISEGWFRRAMPSTLAQNKTFFSLRDKCATRALNIKEWHSFKVALEKTNKRDFLIACCMFQGAKRISEVLNAKLEQIDWEKNIIRYHQSKNGGTLKEIPISYSGEFLDELKKYIDKTKSKRKADKPYIFVTHNGNAIDRQRLNYSFQVASERANVKRVTPHTLRATWVTWVKQNGVQDTEIMKVTGHSSTKMIYAYDKTNLEDNYTKKLVLV